MLLGIRRYFWFKVNWRYHSDSEPTVGGRQPSVYQRVEPIDTFIIITIPELDQFLYSDPHLFKGLRNEDYPVLPFFPSQE